jgi:tetraacyldisaccharide 4'-kinase
MTGAGSALVEAWYRGDRWLWLLRPLEWLFRGATAIRRFAYRNGLLSVYRAPVPVVVVGNITVGGTGKTPVIIALCEYLHGQGLRVGVVSRGYGARHGVFPHHVTQDSTAADCGDEALLVLRRTGCTCVVAPKRAAAIKALLALDDVDLILADDGLQHYAMARDFEIVLMDAQRRSGNGFCLPAGPLREPLSRLNSVDQLLIRGRLETTADDKSGAVVAYSLTHCWALADGTDHALSPEVLGRQVYAVAGIGQPEQFFQQLEALGFVLERRPFPDHHHYQAGDFEALRELPILMTEKDAVKCADLAGDRAYAVCLQAQLPEPLLRQLASLVES